MEQPRVRLVLLLALIAAALGVAWAGWRAARPGRGDLAEVSRVVPAGRRVVVEVLNGSGRPGLARLATRVLRRAGFDVISYGTAADRSDTTLVLIRRGPREAGQWMLEALGTGRLREEVDTLRRVDLSVTLGPDWRPPPVLIP